MTAPHFTERSIGQTFGSWTVIAVAKSKRDVSHVTCRCACGTIRDVEYRNLLRGRSRDCGCGRKKTLGASRRTHGEGQTRLYHLWHGMIRRCIDARAAYYQRYGGRGITVCQEWQESFASFKEWALSAGYSDDKEIDRIDNDGNYEPNNCRWVTRKENARNTGRAILLTAFGETKCIAEWGDDERCVVTRHTLLGRIKRGWSPEDAIRTPNRQ